MTACLANGYYRSVNSLKNKTNRTSSNVYFAISPNPAVNEFRVNYYFYSVDEKPVLEIYNAMNQKVKTVVLDTNKKEQVVDCSEMRNGLYFYSLISNNNIIQQGKIALIK